jgi:hypothetical protein
MWMPIAAIRRYHIHVFQPCKFKHAQLKRLNQSDANMHFNKTNCIISLKMTTKQPGQETFIFSIQIYIAGSRGYIDQLMLSSTKVYCINLKRVQFKISNSILWHNSRTSTMHTSRERFRGEHAYLIQRRRWLGLGWPISGADNATPARRTFEAERRNLQLRRNHGWDTRQLDLAMTSRPANWIESFSEWRRWKYTGLNWKRQAGRWGKEAQPFLIRFSHKKHFMNNKELLEWNE